MVNPVVELSSANKSDFPQNVYSRSALYKYLLRPRQIPEVNSRETHDVVTLKSQLNAGSATRTDSVTRDRQLLDTFAIVEVKVVEIVQAKLLNGRLLEGVLNAG